jgi:hypothetical protein
MTVKLKGLKNPSFNLDQIRTILKKTFNIRLNQENGLRKFFKFQL